VFSDLPDFARIIDGRLASPSPLRTGDGDAMAQRLGWTILRQLTSGAPPGGASPLRLSSIGSCARRLYYRASGAAEDGKTRDGRSTAIFAVGDAVEALLTTALAEALQGATDGPGALWELSGVRGATGQAKINLMVDLPGLKTPVWIPGHPDGVLLGPTDDGGTQPAAVLEVKSASSYGVARVEGRLRSGLDGWSREDSYWWQIQGYMAAMDHLPLAYVLMMCKDSGHIVGFWLKRDPEFMPLLIEHIGPLFVGGWHSVEMPWRRLPDGTVLEPADAERYMRSGKRRDGSVYVAGDPKPGAGKLPWQCHYCPYFRPCWGSDLEEGVVRDYRGRPSRGLFMRSKKGPSQ